MVYACVRRAPVFVFGALAVVGCANSGKNAGNGTLAPSGGADAAAIVVGAGSGSSGGNGSSGDISPGAPGSIVIGDSGGGDACQHLNVEFLPKIPLVYVLVDRSGSMFQVTTESDGGTTDEWTPLRTATLAVIQNLQSQVAFGFGAYTGINPNTTPNMCPIVSPAIGTIPFVLGNYQAIADAYGGIGQPMFKAETPAQKSLDVVGQALGQATSQFDGGAAGQAGGKYILFVTDGETDFCDDGNPVCPADAVVAELQKLYGEGIQTLILGIGSNLSNISVPVLQAFANAGAGLPVVAPPSGGAQGPLSPSAIFDQCNSVTGWNELWTAAGLAREQALATYATAAPASSATVYSPDVTNVADLTDKLAAALSTVKSCSFDLQGRIKVDLANVAEGHVTIDGVAVPYDSTNGWTMASATQLDLVGAACQTWRTTGMDINFDFPCDIIISLQ